MNKPEEGHNPYTWWLRGWQACAHYNEEWQDDPRVIAEEWAKETARLAINTDPGEGTIK